MSAEAEIRRRIQQQGPITFAEFMEVALYWPDGGYYTSAQPFGAAGDYYTSPMVHPAFGALLVVQLFQMWQIMARPSPFCVVETGAGTGLLGRDIISYSANFPDAFQDSLRYLSLDRRASPEERAGICSITTESIPLRGVTGCVLSNEFLDAFPVHQVRVEQGQLREVYVDLERDTLAEVLGEPSTPALEQRLLDLDITLAEGQTVEINLGLAGWAEAIGSALDTGFVVSIDYGREATELYSTEIRPRGTLTTYYRHIQMDAPLRHVGQQDLSAQVDFTSVMAAGRRAGLQPVGLTTQARFLNNLGLGQFRKSLMSLTLAPADLRANQSGLISLVSTTGLGNFKVLVQGKNVGCSSLWGLEPSFELPKLINEMPVPLLTAEHIRLSEGRYPQGEYEIALEELWPFEPGGGDALDGPEPQS